MVTSEALKGQSVLQCLLAFEDVLYLPGGPGDHLPDAAQLIPVHPPGAQLSAEQPAEDAHLAPYLTHLRRELGVPPLVSPAPDILDGPPVLLKELAALVGDGVDLLAVPLGSTHVAH